MQDKLWLSTISVGRELVLMPYGNFARTAGGRTPITRTVTKVGKKYFYIGNDAFSRKTTSVGTMLREDSSAPQDVISCGLDWNENAFVLSWRITSTHIHATTGFPVSFRTSASTVVLALPESPCRFYPCSFLSHSHCHIHSSP